MPKESRYSAIFVALLLTLSVASHPSRADVVPGPSADATDGTWKLQFPINRPLPEESEAGVYDPVRGRMITFGGWDGFQALTDTRALDLATTSWTRLATTGPPARYAHTMVYDPVRDRVLMFGGRDASSNWFGDVWALPLSGPPTWTQLTPVGPGPSGRFGHEAIYDPVRDRMLVFGGYDDHFKNDVWELTLAGTPTWAEVTTTGTPPVARDFPAGIYDPLGDRLILFGGNRPTGVVNETWTLSLAGVPTWTQLTTVGVPPQRMLHEAVYDSQHQRLVTFGGYDGTFWTNQTWALSLTGTPNWTNLNPLGTVPAARSDLSMIYDPVQDRAVVFGGRNFSRFFDDIFSLSLAGSPAWTKNDVVGEPGPGKRILHGGAYDPLRRRFVVFGGYHYGGGWLNDLWAFDLGNTPAWTKLDLVGLKPPARSDYALIAQPPADRLILFGGKTSDTYLNDLWQFNQAAGTWSPLVAAGAPPSPRAGQSAIYDAPRNRMLVFGGIDLSGISLNETWELTLGPTPTWSLLTPAGTYPSGRYSQAMAYDSHSDRVIIHGGYDSNEFKADAWALSLGGSPAWTNLLPVGIGPGSLTGHGMVYDPLRDRMVIFAGFTGFVFSNNTYALNLASGPPAWSRLFPQGRLPIRRDFFATMYDPVIDRMLVMGGNTLDGTEDVEDVWSLDWLQVPTPTLLSFAEEQIEPGTVKLTWYTPDGAGQQATAYRRTETTEWEALGTVVSDASSRFVLEDRVAGGGRYAYRLGVGTEFTDEHWVSIPGSLTFALDGAWPNPSAGRMQVRFSLPNAAPAALDLLDIRGRRVLHRDLTALGVGPHVVNLDRQGSLPPGVYMLRLTQGDREQKQKIAIIR